MKTMIYLYVMQTSPGVQSRFCSGKLVMQVLISNAALDEGGLLPNLQNKPPKNPKPSNNQASRNKTSKQTQANKNPPDNLWRKPYASWANL